MFLGMQDSDFAQISPQFCPDFAQIQPNLPKSNQFSKKNLLGDAATSSAPTALNHNITLGRVKASRLNQETASKIFLDITDDELNILFETFEYDFI